SGDVRRQDLATLYAVNTLGAVAGCVVATFFLLEVYGTRATLWLAAAINILIAVIARVVDRRGADDRVLTESHAPDGSAFPAPPAPPAPRALPAQPDLPDLTVFLLTASATVGFAFFLMELVWYRMLAPLLG